MKPQTNVDQAKLLDINNIHVYVTPTKKRYPSVTTILNATKSSNNDGLERWKEKIGAEKAADIYRRSSIIGTAAHDMNEKWLTERKINIPDIEKEDLDDALRHHENFKPFIEKVDLLYGAELRLWSDNLKTAGSADVACKYDGIQTILDYKTKRKEQIEEYVVDYYLQSTAYAIMFEELSNIHIEQIVVLCSYDHTVQEFKSIPEKWTPLLMQRLASFDYDSVSLYDKGDQS